MSQLVIPSNPIVITAPQGTSSLPLVEIDKNILMRKHKPIRSRKDSARRKVEKCSFGNSVDNLDFSAWEFFHAAKKTELASSFTNTTADLRAFLFAAEHENTFIWNTGNLRKTDSSVFALEDFASAGLAGRIGEAIAYLTMIKWGYVFWDRCATVWERAARGASINHSEQLHVAQYLSSQVASGRPQNEPDFIFEKSNGDVALMEAKGSFVNPAKDNPSTKADLNQSLKQLAAWSSVIAPTPQKSYGIGTYLREEHDNNDPSLIAYVDPPGKKKETIQPAELPPDLVRRCNYGAWLEGMGLVSSGRALRDGRGRKIEEITLPTVEIDGRGFVFRHAGFVTSTGQNSHFLAPWDWLNYALNRGHVSGILVMGVDVRIMHIISQSIQNPKASMLKEINSGEATGHLDTRHRESPWSIMPDGSFFGIVDLDTFHKGIEEAKTFNL